MLSKAEVRERTNKKALSRDGFTLDLVWKKGDKTHGNQKMSMCPTCTFTISGRLDSKTYRLAKKINEIAYQGLL